MRPYPEEVLKAIQTGVMAHLLPELQSNYARAQFGFSMLLFTIAQRDYDTAVPDLIEHNTTLRALLAETAAALANVAGNNVSIIMARELLADVPAPADSLKLSDLRKENEALRAGLASLAPIIEPAADEASLAPLRSARTKIFDYLKADARKRIVPILTT
ncbi:MAG: hypothetical protein WEB52_11165 [Dehalococcoidia bacterium]